MSNESRYILHKIQTQLRICWNRLITEHIAAGFALLILTVASGFALLLFIEMRLWMPTGWRSVLFWIWVTASSLLLVWLVIRPWLTGWFKRSNYRRIARIVTKEQPVLQNQLVCLLELCDGSGSPSPQPLVDHAVQILDTEVSQRSLLKKFDWRRSVFWSQYTVIPLGLIVILVLAAPNGFRGASVRLFSPGTTFERPAPFTFTIMPGNTEVTKGDSLAISAEAIGVDLPKSIIFELGVHGERTARSVTVAADSPGKFLHQENNLRFPFRYRVTSGPVESDWYQVSVIDRPVMRNLQITLHPPDYTGLPYEQLPPGIGNITALQGTSVHMQIRSSIPDSRAWLSFDSNLSDVILNDMTGAFMVHHDMNYRILIESPNDIRNLDPISYSVTPIADRSPSIEITSPAERTELGFDLLAPLTIRVQDDFGFSRFSLSWRLSDNRFGDVMESFKELILPLPASGEVQYLWDLDLTTKLDIVPGDAISYFVTIWDNDGYSGPKKTSSRTQELYLPSITERYEALESTQDETESGLESLLDDTEQVRKQFDELRDELRRKQDASWDDRQNLEELQQTQQELQNRVDELASNMAEAAQQMEEHDLVSDELLDLFQELQNVTEEINSPELIEALQELQESLSELDPASMLESLDKFEFNEEMFRERMERTLELFKNFQVQQQLEEAARRAEDLQQVQEKLAEETGADEPSDDFDTLIEEQQQASEEMSSLEAKMEEIVDRMKELQNAPMAQMDQLNQDTQNQELPENMQQNAQQMQAGQMQQANQGQEQMSQSMQQLQSDLQNVQSGMTGQQMQINTAALKLILSNVLRLSHDQENLRHQIAEATRESPLLRDFAREQSILSTGNSVIADSLQSLARSLPQLSRNIQQLAGESMLNMSASTESLTERNNNAAESHASQAMTSLNNLALLLSDLLNQLMNSSSSNSGSGMSMEQMIQQLQQMAGQQDQLNQALEDLLGMEPGERLSTDMQERLQQIAAQQEAMRRQLTEMAKERDLVNQLAGDLERIAQQMEESIQEFQSGQVNRPTRQRQQQILTRLLDASRSLQERGREQTREGRRGSEFEPSDPPELLEQNMTQQELRRALMNALESGYTKDYQALIQRYFELLQNQ
ncbi:MAG: chromosome partitioning protein ParA [Bacteroidetes bacterium]|nr:chromosome partitioning protein ParA [Bacteroidota bacterium]